MRGSVTVHIAAPPARVWELVSDVTNVGTFSPETFEAEWLDGATGPALGGRFRGHVRRNGKAWLVYWTTCTITTCEPGRDFCFEVGSARGGAIVTWRYQLRPDGDGTQVTESFELHDSVASRLYASVAGKARTRTNLANMRATLERMKTAVESGEVDAE